MWQSPSRSTVRSRSSELLPAVSVSSDPWGATLHSPLPEQSFASSSPVHSPLSVSPHKPPPGSPAAMLSTPSLRPPLRPLSDVGYKASTRNPRVLGDSIDHASMHERAKMLSGLTRSASADRLSPTPTLSVRSQLRTSAQGTVSKISFATVQPKSVTSGQAAAQRLRLLGSREFLVEMAARTRQMRDADRHAQFMEELRTANFALSRFEAIHPNGLIRSPTAKDPFRPCLVSLSPTPTHSTYLHCAPLLDDHDSGRSPR